MRSSEAVIAGLSRLTRGISSRSACENLAARGQAATPLRQCSLSARVVSGWRMLTSTRAHYPVPNGTTPFDAGARCMTKPMPKLSCEVSIVAKATGVRDLAQRLVCSQRCSAIHKARGVVQTKRVYEFTAG
jgi:hypothetical protein